MRTYNLESCPLFARLEPAEIEAVGRFAEPLSFRTGEPLFEVGDPADAFYLVTRGTVLITVPETEQEEAKTVTLRQGGFFGEIGLVRECPRTAAAFAQAGSKLVKIPRKAFEDLMWSDAVVARKIILAIFDRLNEFDPLTPVPRRSAREPQVVMVVSAGGQEGASFLTSNMAVKLRSATTLPVLAVDLHFENQGLWRYLGSLSDHGDYDELLHADFIGGDEVKGAAALLDCGVELLAGPAAEMSDALRPRHAHEILKAARGPYSYVFVDPGPVQDLMRAEAARGCDAALVVCQPTEESIERADGHARWLAENGLKGRVRFVINKVPKEPEIDPSVIQQVLGERLLGTVRVSESDGDIGAAASAPVVAAKPESPLALEISALCQGIRSGDMLHPPTTLGKVRDLLLWGFGVED